MATSQDAEYYPVQLGSWTNWSRGSVFGPTVTLRRREGDLLIAFTALFVALVATRGWRVLSFAFHRYHASSTPQGALYHQHQAVLRNASDAQSSILLLANLLWVNMDKKRKIVRPLLTTLVAILYTIAFTVAGGFSSQISTAVGTEVLIKSKNCGWNDAIPPDSIEYAFLLTTLEAGEISNAANYAQQCYSSDAAGILDCGRLSTKKIPTHINTQAGCPFHDDVCRDTNANLRIDSGYIDSHHHFGLNTPPSERILTRYVAHCAPMKTQGYSSHRNTTVGNITVYHYGNMTTSTGVKDYMGTAKSIKSQYAYLLSPDTVQITANYELNPFPVHLKNRSVNQNSSTFVPADSIFRPDADLMVVLLAGNGVLHTKPSGDKWYRVSPTSSNIGTTGADGSRAQTYFPPLEEASPLGCAYQWQFCRQTAANCGPLGSFDDAVTGAAPIFNTTYEDLTSMTYSGTTAAHFYYLATVTGKGSSLYGVLEELGPTSLQSQNSLAGGHQGPLPSNQWQLDVIHWIDIYMANLQLSFLRSAYFNPTDKSAALLRRNVTTQAEKTLCMNQKIKSTSHSSFSLFGLLFTYIVGVLIIATSFLLEPVSWLLYKKWGYKQHATLEWTANTTLQMQRLAHEGLGFGTWSKGTEAVPVAKSGDMLGCLDYTNPDHPVLSSAAVMGESQASLSSTLDESEGRTSVDANDAPSAAPVAIEGESSVERPDVESRPEERDENRRGNV